MIKHLGKKRRMDITCQCKNIKYIFVGHFHFHFFLSIMHKKNSHLKIKPPQFSHRYWKCMFVASSIEYISLPYCVDYTKYYCLVRQQFYLSCSILNVNHPCRVANTKCNSTSFVILCNLFLGITLLLCCNYYHLLYVLSSKFQSSMTIFYYISVLMQNTPKVDELKVS